MRKTFIFSLFVAFLCALAANAQTQNVAKDASQHQMHILLENNDVKYYNTNSLTSVDINDNTVKVNTAAGSDEFVGTVRNISFKKGSAGDITHPAGAVEITEAKGWLESAYVKFNLYENVKTYNVYVKGGQFSEYTKLDAPLVRNYGSYGRADMVGLPAGSYDMKVVAVDAEGNEIEGSAAEARNMLVAAYDRTGFAHFNMQHEIGAYDKSGKLLPGAKVLYITAKTAKTVKTTVRVDKKDVETTGIQAIIDAYQKGTDTTPLAIRTIGKISKEDLDKISSSAEGLQVKGRNGYSHMPITIEGIGDDATVHGFGFLLRNCGYTELRNFAIMCCMDDCVSMDTNNEHLWIHNLDLFYGNAGGDADQAKGDGTLDIKGNSRYTTMSYNHLFDSGKASLCGMGGDSEEYISYVGNWFDHSDSRHPRVRCMTVHVLNNYYDGVAKYGVGATTGADIFVENNYFRNTKYPMLISKQGSDIATDAKGTFSGEDGGMIKSFGNKIVGAKRYVTYQENAVQFDAYEAATRNETVPAEAKCLQGGDTYNNFDTDASRIYAYEPIAAEEVPQTVTGWLGAGRLGHGDFKWTFTEADDADYDVNKALKAAIVAYQSSLVGVFGDENQGGGNQGGNPGENPGGNPGEITGSITCHFTGKTPSNSAFTISGNYSNSKGSATVDGIEYKDCLKMESATSIKFTTTAKMKLSLYFASTETGKSVKVDGTKYKTDENAVATVVLEAGEHEITKGDSINLFYIKMEKTE